MIMHPYPKACVGDSFHYTESKRDSAVTAPKKKG